MTPRSECPEAPERVREHPSALARAQRPLANTALLCLACLGTSACITSRTGAYLNADEAAATKLSRCADGLIEDMEDNDNQVIKAAGRGGYWFTFFDAEGSTIEPRGNFVMSPGGYSPESRFHAHAKGKMASSGPSIYAGLGFNLADPKGPFDASKYKGISFWAKGPGTVRFKTPDVNTDPTGDRCQDCYNDFGVDIHLSKHWTRYTVPFDKMKQQPGWGDPAPGVAKDGLLAVQWQVGRKGEEYEVSIDDVEFVGCD